MNDNPDPGSSSPDPRPKEDAAGLSETELDDMLAQASSLATGLSEELGSTQEEPTHASQESPAASDAGVEPSNSDAEPQRNLEGELENLDELIAATSSELNEPARAESEPAAGKSADKSDSDVQPSDAPSEKIAGAPKGEDGEANDEPAASTDASVPTFMDELTQPEAPAESVPEIKTPDRDDATPAEESPNKPPEESGAVTGSPQAKPGIVGTGMLGVVSTPGASPIPEVADGVAAMPASEENTDTGPGEPDPSPSGSVLSRLLALPLVVVSRLGPVSDLLCQKGISLLDLMDWPLQRTGVLVRRLLGLVALATMAISIIVLVISLF